MAFNKCIILPSLNFSLLISYIAAFLIVLNSFNAHCQPPPDSVVIKHIMYRANHWDTEQNDSLAQTRVTVFKLRGGRYESPDTIVDGSLIMMLLREVNAPRNLSNSLSRYGIDTTWIKSHPDEVLRKSAYHKKYAWNPRQKELIIKELGKIANHTAGLANFLQAGCCYTMHQWYRYQYVITFYKNGRAYNQITSRKYLYGYRYPWITGNGDSLFTVNIERIVNELSASGSARLTAELHGNKLLRKLANWIVEQNYEELHRLAPYSYQTEIDELEPTFRVLYYNSITGYGGYNGDPAIQIVLHNNEMLPGVNVEFLASKLGKSIYSRDSVIKDYKAIVGKVQSIKFITDYLAANPSYHLNILYSDNRAINQYNINMINKNPAEWAKYEKHEKLIEEARKILPDNSANRLHVQKISERLYCGCNYRFDNDFINKAISFNIDNAEGTSHSRWVLLLDNRVLLYLSSGEIILNHHYTEFGDHPGMLYPCVMFDTNGNIIPKKNQ